MTGVPARDAGDVERLRELAERATPGPWVRYFSDAQKADHIRSAETREWVTQFVASVADAEFIAAARNLLPALLDERDELIEDAESMRLSFLHANGAAIEASKRAWAEKARADALQRAVDAVRELVATMQAEIDRALTEIERRQIAAPTTVTAWKAARFMLDDVGAALAAAGAPQEGTQR